MYGVLWRAAAESRGKESQMGLRGESCDARSHASWTGLDGSSSFVASFRAY